MEGEMHGCFFFCVEEGGMGTLEKGGERRV